MNVHSRQSEIFLAFFHPPKPFLSSPTTNTQQPAHTHSHKYCHIQFKALSLPGEPAAESHCFYLSAADMVRPDEYDPLPTTPPPSSGKGAVGESFKSSAKNNHDEPAAVADIVTISSPVSLTHPCCDLHSLSLKQGTLGPESRTSPCSVSYCCLDFFNLVFVLPPSPINHSIICLLLCIHAFLLLLAHHYICLIHWV